MGSNIFIQLFCHKKIQSPTSLKTGAASYYSCRTDFLWITVPKLCELFPGFLCCLLCPAARFWFLMLSACLSCSFRAGCLCSSADSPIALFAHPHDPWKNVLTGTYQIPMLSVPFSVLTLDFWGSWFPKRPLTVKLSKGWGRHAGQELLLNLHHSFLDLHPGWHPLPCAGNLLERLQSSVLQHPVTLWSVPTFQSCQSRLSLLLCSQPGYFGATHPLAHEADLTQASHERAGPGWDQTVSAASVVAGRDAQSPEHSRSTKCQISISTELWL